MKCDIIIPVWNQLDFTRDCIENIEKNTRIPYRLILIDNASDHETRTYLESLKKTESLDILLIRNEKNEGFVKAVNQGLKASTAPYICVLNNDTIPARGWLDAMIDFAESHKDAGLINPQCDGHGTTPIDIYADSLKKRKGEYMEMNQCQGFCMLIKRQVIDKIGYLDEAFGVGGFDDTDYSMRAHLAGYRCVSIKSAYVYHRLHGSFKKLGGREDWVKRNKKIYYKKWGKHLRVGIAAPLKALDREKISRLIALAYGLAREWSWVHLWINFRGDKKLVKKLMSDIMLAKGLPPHQNIRLDCLNMPNALFDIALSGKLLERLKPRMKDKRFDAVITMGEVAAKTLPRLAKALGLKVVSAPFGEEREWQEEGKKIAADIKAKRRVYD